MPDSCGLCVGRRVPVLLGLVPSIEDCRCNATSRRTAGRVGGDRMAYVYKGGVNLSVLADRDL